MGCKKHYRHRNVDNGLCLNYICINYMKAYDLKDDPYLNVLRPLVEAYQAIFEVGHRHIRSMGLTPAQFDVIAELGGTSGMTAVELSQSTLLAKASLTGIIDRLEEKGLVDRQPVPEDRRAMNIRLTKTGIEVHRQCFPLQANVMRPYFSEALNKEEIKKLREMLVRLRDSCRNGVPDNQSAPKRPFLSRTGSQKRQTATKSRRVKLI